MGLFKVRAGDAATLQKQNFSQSELAHSSTPTYAASEEGPQKWADGDYKSSYKPASSASLGSVTTESAASPSQNHSPYHSSGLDANSAAGRLRQVDQFGYSRSTDQISLESKATISVDHSASTRHLEARAIRHYHIPYPREVSSPASISKNTPTSSSLAPPPMNRGDAPTTIGMALGSPSHPPGSAEAPWNQTQVLTTVTSGGDASESSSNPNGMSRSMSKRWNPFSRTKSKRSKPADSPASRAAGTDLGKSMDLGSRSNLAKNGGDKESDRKGSAARKDSSSSLSRHPIPDMPVLPNSRDAAAPTREAPAPPQIQVEQPKQLQSLLSIEIPTIEMERYSIMFGNILQKQQQQHQYFLQPAQESQPPKEPQLEAQAEQTAKLQQVQEAQEVQEVLEIQVPQRPEEPRRPAPSPRPQRSNSKESENPEEPQEPQQSQDSLQSPQQPSQQSPRPSLPVRRQIKIERLNLPAAKSYRDGSVPIEIIVPRRGSSPLPESTPSDSLAVPNQAPAGNPPRLSSRRRSNTTPAAVVNFPTPAMYKVPAQSRKRTTSVSTPSNEEPPLPADAETTPERRERLISKFHHKESPSESSMPKVTDQPSESPASVSTQSQSQPQPPQPRSILKKPSGPPPPPPTNRVAKPVAASQEAAPPKQHQHQVSMASIRTNADEEEVEKALYEAVEVSIARQISVSRQQRKLLVPLNRSASRRNPGEPAPDAASNIKLDKNKRLVETRTAVPVLVHPASRANTPQGGGGGYRKSSRVVLEGA
ncbi:uncharacterized protein Triagg1_2369 [Trichoderma aggressivum f. europaeum]|uniref:Uncharacterized protein n=1 Tax=Trichoderma aggressivum f. europaeum TaxID=173218 RepID=A0AAE1IGW8_9HYPO|nr:hypothetical protein Triagg1_2369 [Trichoderma aggressivum f. europaeum]